MINKSDIIFTYAKQRTISKLIAYVTCWKTDYKKEPKLSHVSCYIGDKLIYEVYFCGPRIKNIKRFNLKSHNVYIGKVLTDYDKNLLVSNLIDSEGQGKYAIWQLFAILFKKLFGLNKVGDVQKDAVQCTEKIVREFKKVGVDFFPDLDPAEVDPLMLFNSSKIETVKVESWQ